MRALILFIFFLTSTLSIAQENEPQKKLLKEAQKNHVNFNENTKKAFENAGLIIKNAKKINAHKAELTAIMTQCKYYRRDSDYKNMMIFARVLEQKSQEYNQPVYEASALVYQSEVYYHNSQPDKWNHVLNNALKLLERSNPKDSLAIITKSNVYSCFSNYHTDFENRLKYIKKSIAVQEEFLDERTRGSELYMSYSNLAVVYYKFKIDSAKYYALLSLSQTPSNGESEYNNYLVLSKAELVEGNYNEVIAYVKKAENIKGYKDWYNTQLLYDNAIEAYQKLNDEKNVVAYKSKNDSLAILISQNQNKYLLRALKENEKPLFGKMFVIISSIALILLVVIIYLILKKRKNKSSISEQVILEIEPQYDYSKLIEILKRKDKSFMIHFDEAYPEFSKKLLEINQKMVQSEIEFCALLKLKIPTKDIASYTNIEAKTVRNKKYRMRRKLNIPEGVDIYQWFNEF